MKVSFDGLRLNIAKNFNRVATEIKDIEKTLSRESLKWLKQDLGDLRGSIGGLLACYDKDQQPEDFNDLSDVELEEL